MILVPLFLSKSSLSFIPLFFRGILACWSFLSDRWCSSMTFLRICSPGSDFGLIHTTSGIGTGSLILFSVTSMGSSLTSCSFTMTLLFEIPLSGWSTGSDSSLQWPFRGDLASGTSDFVSSFGSCVSLLSVFIETALDGSLVSSSSVVTSSDFFNPSEII